MNEIIFYPLDLTSSNNGLLSSPKEDLLKHEDVIHFQNILDSIGHNRTHFQFIYNLMYKTSDIREVSYSRKSDTIYVEYGLDFDDPNNLLQYCRFYFLIHSFGNITQLGKNLHKFIEIFKTPYYAIKRECNNEICYLLEYDISDFTFLVINPGLKKY
jgi:hypothetical protein